MEQYLLMENLDDMDDQFNDKRKIMKFWALFTVFIFVLLLLICLILAVIDRDTNYRNQQDMHKQQQSQIS